MTVIFNHWHVTVTRGSDSRIQRESIFWYYLRKAVNALGYDVVRQIPKKDGHLTSMPYYLKDRKSGEAFIWDGNYALRMAHEEYNKGTIDLACNGAFKNRIKP